MKIIKFRLNLFLATISILVNNRCIFMLSLQKQFLLTSWSTMRFVTDLTAHCFVFHLVLRNILSWIIFIDKLYASSGDYISVTHIVFNSPHYSELSYILVLVQNFSMYNNQNDGDNLESSRQSYETQSYVHMPYDQLEPYRPSWSLNSGYYQACTEGITPEYDNVSQITSWVLPHYGYFLKFHD